MTPQERNRVINSINLIHEEAMCLARAGLNGDVEDVEIAAKSYVNTYAKVIGELLEAQ